MKSYQKASETGQKSPSERGWDYQALIVNPGVGRHKDGDKHQWAAVFHPVPCVASRPEIGHSPGAAQRGRQVLEPDRVWAQPTTHEVAETGNVFLLDARRAHHLRILDPRQWVDGKSDRAARSHGNRCSGQEFVAS